MRRTLTLFSVIGLTCLTATISSAQEAVVNITPPPATTTITGSLWSNACRPLYVDTKCRKVGDLLTVVIVQQSSSSTSAQHKTNKGSGVTADAGSGLFEGFSGFGVKSSQSTTGSGASSAVTTFTDRITATVVDVLPNGCLRIEGTRKMKMEKDEVSLIFSGTIRPEDILADNTISSIMVADMQLQMQGLGPIAEKTRPGILSKLFGFLF